jgi:hypothetical protein
MEIFAIPFVILFFMALVTPALRLIFMFSELIIGLLRILFNCLGKITVKYKEPLQEPEIKT